MTSFVSYDVTTDFEVLIDDALDALAAKFPGWVPSEAHLEVALIEELARIARETALVAAEVPSAVFDAFGSKLMGILRTPGSASSMTSTWTMVDDDGYVIPEGTAVGYRVTGDEIWIFRTAAEQTIAPGATQKVGVVLEADDLLSERNGVASGSALELVDALSFVASIVTTSASAGGEAAETDEAYLDRLADELTLMSPRPILPDDFATLARRTPGVTRAVAIDGYNPADQTFGNFRMVALAALDSLGNPISAGVKAQLEADLEAMREIGFVVNVPDPTANAVVVAFRATVHGGFDEASVLADAETAVKAYLDPAKWGGGDEEPPAWRLETAVREYEIVAALEHVTGLDRVTSLWINGAAADFALTGAAPIPSTVGAVIADDYDRADIANGLGNSLSGHAWIVQSGTWGISGNRGYESANVASASAVIAAASQDGILTADLTLDVSPDCGVVFRGIDANNYLFIVLGASSALWKRDAGVASSLVAGTAVAPSVTHSVEVRLSGNRIQVLIDDVVHIDYTLAGANATKFGSGAANALRFGMQAYQDIGARFDNFEFRQATAIRGEII